MTARTSSSHPLRIDSVTVSGGGRVGMTFCPGKKDRHAMTGRWDRDLDADLASIREWGASLLVTLVEDHELALLEVPDLGSRARDHGLDWLHLPIVDVSVPSAVFEAAWPRHARACRYRDPREYQGRLWRRVLTIASSGTRTPNPLIKSQLLCQLS